MFLCALPVGVLFIHYGKPLQKWLFNPAKGALFVEKAFPFFSRKSSGNFCHFSQIKFWRRTFCYKQGTPNGVNITQPTAR